MPFIPHTNEDIAHMLATIGAPSIKTLFDEIPKELNCGELTAIPPGCNELAITRIMQNRAPHFQPGRCFIGAGAYEHHIPAAVWQLVGRGEFYTAYTPYQAEASQGSLQLIYEYQSMMTALMAMDISNASLYDGSTALAEACLMAIRIKKNTRKILLPNSVHPAYHDVLKTILLQRDIEIISIAIDAKSGTLETATLQQQNLAEVAALVIPQPNFFGCLEAVDTLTDWAAAHNLLTIAVVNPIAMALLKPPGLWGKNGADIACGEGQPLGVPLAYGGPYFGILCCKEEFVRQMPGRLVGKTEDREGRVGYTLTLQAREQHIRRAKATSNICTNQGLLVVAASIYLSLLGSEGLHEVALSCHQHALTLKQMLCTLPGIKTVYSAPFFHEFVIELPGNAKKIVHALNQQGIAAGFVLSNHDNRLLVCATETKTSEDLEHYCKTLKLVLQSAEVA